jgi:TatD DNase family protein
VEFKEIGKILAILRMSTIIDTHCHLYLPEFGNDINSVLERARNEHVSRFYLPAIDSTTHDQMIGLEAQFPENCYAMMGLHPCSVKDDYENELDIVLKWLDKRKFVGIGEVGLDYYWDTTRKEQQKAAFRTQIRWGIERKLPVIIHSRESTDDCIEMIKQEQNGDLTGIFHCFSGNLEQAKKIIDLGFFLGIGGVITYKNSGLAAVVEALPLTQVVLETDAPYLSPIPYRGKRNESSYLKYVVEKIAAVKGITVEEVSDITTQNAQKIFGR